MFVCKECESNLRLTKAGREWPWGESDGSCESCDKVATCKDISSQWDWVWDDDINSDADLIAYTQRNLKNKNGEAKA